MSSPKIFWAPMDNGALGMTLAVAAICMGLPVAIYFAVPAHTVFTTGLCVLPIAVFLGLSLFVVKSYHLEEHVLCIKRTLWTTQIPLRPLDSAEFLPEAMAGSLKVCASSGVFGWIGSFRSESLGTYQAWVTDRQKTIVLKSGSRTYVISPLEPKKFLQALQPLKV